RGPPTRAGARGEPLTGGPPTPTRRERPAMADGHLDRVGAVLVVEIAREEHRNAISGTMLAELADAFDEARRDDAIRAVVTTARGQTFRVGGDLPEMLAGLDLPTHRFLNGPEVGGDRGYGVLSDDQARLEQLGVGR